jgi:hypothetical protein
MDMTRNKERPSKKAVEITAAGNTRQFDIAGCPVTFMPLAIKRRHFSKVLIAPTETTEIKSSFDLPLIRTLGKAFYWQRLLDTGEAANAQDLAKRFKLEPG